MLNVTIELPHCSPIGAKAIRHNLFRHPISPHDFLQKLQSSLAVTLLGDKYFKNFAFVIHSSSQIVNFTVNPNKYLVQMPFPLWKSLS